MKKLRAHTFFSEDEREHIRRTVECAEADTSGEIATMVVDNSDNYQDAEVLGAVLLSGLLAIIIAVAIHHITIWSYIPLAFLLFFPLRALLRMFPRLKLPMLTMRRMAHAVRDRAVRAFYEKGLYRTKDETGILIFISLLERKVWILGDRGIDRKIPHETWQLMAGELSLGLRENRACEALCTVIEKCGAVLAEHFPKRPDDTDELPDEILT